MVAPYDPRRDESVHPLDGPRLKIARAEKQVEALHSQERAFWNAKYYRIIPAEVDEKTGEQLFRVLIDAYPSLDWGICIGEIAHNLRSALDGLVWQLALLNTDSPANNSQFPIFRIGTTKRRQLNGKLVPQFSTFGRRAIRSLRLPQQEAIEAFQPYKRKNGGPASPLYQLQEINNADKHRPIQVVGSRLGAVTTSFFGEGTGSESFFHESQWDMREMLEDGAIIGRGPVTAAPMDPAITPSIAFWKGCPAVGGKRVTRVLSAICEEVSKIVESFRSDFQ